MPDPRQKAIKVVLFDKDGTLVDFRATWLPPLRAAAAELATLAAGGKVDSELADALLRRHGYEPDTDRFVADSPILWATIRHLASLWQAEPEIRHLGGVEAVLERHCVDLARYPPVPVTDLAALFDRLIGRGLQLGVATMDAAAVAEATLAGFGVRDRIAYLCGRDSGHGEKPEPGMVRGCCAALGVHPTEIAVVGDTLADMAMARAAGAGLAVGVLTGGCEADALAAVADLVLTSIVELEDALDPSV